ncbi:DNA polymerase epsilon subunit 4 [Fopius arisanus]|uniref:DNA polymerase epsilon subunit 4 n=1 Tax=Fopius arisanus TaxID=64838 RepID=A0A9R1TKE8_9HYME|nr:PREDICTED: DNA polymerase epsilon subunit 4 [Fopius arisanus]
METPESDTETPTEDQVANISISSRSEQSHDSQEEVESEPKEKLLKLPVGRVKHIVKSDPDVNLVNQEAIFLIAKSAELFIDSLSKEAFKYTFQAKKKTVQKKDLDQAIDNVDSLAFLEGMLEQMM